MVFLKIVDGKLVQAPYEVKKGGKRIFGYCKENNEAMLFEDGYAKFPYGASHYEIKNGQIVEKVIPPPEPQTVFTKLQIRRAMRQLGIEDELNAILSGNFQFQSDWNDAQDIDLNDSMIQDAIEEGLITREMIEAIREVLG